METTAIRNRIIGHRQVVARDLAPHPSNWRTHPEEQRRTLRGVVDQVGFARSLLAYVPDAHKADHPDPLDPTAPLMLIDGHLRREDLADETLTVEVLDVTDEEAKLLLATLDPLAALASADGDKLKSLLTEINSNSDAVQAMLNDLAERYVEPSSPAGVDPDEVPAAPDEATTRPGDLWILGNHRLLCGDSSSPTDVDRLCDNKPIHLINTDPPYNVRVEPRSNNAIASGRADFGRYLATQQQRTRGKRTGQDNHQGFDLARDPGKVKPTTKQMRPKDRPLENDFIADEDFEAQLELWFGNMAKVLLPGHAFYIWGGWSNLGNYPPVLKRCGMFWHQQIIWVKNQPVLCRKDFMLQHEWCFYGWREGAGHRWFGPNNMRDVWQVDKVPTQQMVHLTEKPVELAHRAIALSSKRGERVLDLFGGSGSTLIACEQTERHARLMELDPPYCDVIVQRWEKFTGRKAELEAGTRRPSKADR